MDFIEWLIGTVAYCTMSGVSFKVLANRAPNPSKPMDTPGPFFGALAWPLAIPFILGTSMPADKASRDSRRRGREIEEAKHLRAVAEVNSERMIIEAKVNSERTILEAKALKAAEEAAFGPINVVREIQPK